MESEKGKLFVVETKDTCFVSPRKLDATYKHVEFLYGQAKYKEVSESNFKTSKKVVWIGNDEEL